MIVLTVMAMHSQWSDDILITELADEPALADDLAALIQRVEAFDAVGASAGERGSADDDAKAKARGKSRAKHPGRSGSGGAASVPHMVLNFSAVTYIGSSNIGQLLRLRKALAEKQRQMKLCSVSEQVRSIFSVTGLDKVFRFAPDPMTALAGIQLEAAEK